MSNWTLFSNHGHVLICLARNPESRLRDVAADVGITERAVQKIVRDLQDEGMVSVTKHGRRNHYRIHHRQHLRHDLEAHCTLGELMRFVNRSKAGSETVTKSKDSAPDSPTAVPSESLPAVSVPEEEPPSSVVIDKPDSNKQKTVKTVAENSIERQQGSLF